MSDYDYDLFVIGAGSGGVRAARMSAQYGARVVIAEEYRVGGTCVIRGCVPKKLFVYASHFAESFTDAVGFGWSFESPPHFDWRKLIANKDSEIDRLNKIYISNLEASGVEIIQSRAVLRDAHHVEIDGRVMSAAYILIATGGTPFVPEFAGHEYAITSNEAFHLDALPAHITIVGGGYIAVEFACIFHGLGVKTRLIYRGAEILKNFDAGLRRHLFDAMVARGIEIKTKTNIKEISKQGDAFHLAYDDGGGDETGLVMYATGRVPHVQGLGLEAAGVMLNGRGEIEVDVYSRTSVENIYAVGDVTGRAALTPVAIREGAAFAETVFNNNPVAVDHSLIPTAIFSQPELGTCGLSEAQARAQEPIDIYETRFRPMLNILANNPEQMFMKLIVSKASDKVLGLHIAGAGAGEMIQAFGVALTMGASKAQFDTTIAVHPTAAEELVTFKTPRD